MKESLTGHIPTGENMADLATKILRNVPKREYLVGKLLYMNDIIPEDASMNAQTLPAVVMPARNRFVDDDRRGGREVR